MDNLNRMIEYELTAPELTEDRAIEGCRLARQYGVAAVVVRPCDVDTAARLLEGSDVAVGSVAGFPHGSSTTAAKLYEGRDLLRRGARELDMVVNISKLLSRQFQHVEMEILQMAEACHKEKALLKVVVEEAHLTDELKIVACRICARAGADFASASTGFGPSAHTAAGLQLMRKHLPERIGLKAEARTLDEALEAFGAGCSRIGSPAAPAILDAWKAALEARQTT